MEFGSFTYGGALYGSLIRATYIDQLTPQVVRIQTSADVLVDTNFTSASNFTLVPLDGGPPIRVLEVLPVRDRSTREILLLTDYMPSGLWYRVTVANLRERNNSGVAFFGDFPTRVTKTESILGSIPAHFTKSVTSNIGALLVAIGLEDEKIGGSRSDDTIYAAANIPGRNPPPTVSITSSSAPSVDGFGLVKLVGTVTFATRVVVFVSDIPQGDAIVNKTYGSWTISVPATAFPDLVPVTLRVAAVGNGGFIEDSQTVTVNVP